MPDKPDDRERSTAIIVQAISSAHSGRFRGGRQNRRDRWRGIENKPDFDIFRRWWHKRGKREFLGRDFADRTEACEAYKMWVELGKPTVK